MKLNLYKIIHTKPDNTNEEEEILELLNTTPTLKDGTYPRAEFVKETNKSQLKADGLKIMQGGSKAIEKINGKLKIVCGFYCINSSHSYIAG